MKRFSKLFGIIALVAIIGFSMVACDDGNGNGGGNELNGTWVIRVGGYGNDGNIEHDETLTFNNGNFEWTWYEASSRGNYTTTDNLSITFNFLEIKFLANSYEVEEFGIEANRWFTKSGLREVVDMDDEEFEDNFRYYFESETEVYSVSGNTLVLFGEIYTRR